MKGKDILRILSAYFPLETATIHHELLSGACGAIIGCTEEDHLGELIGHDAPLDGLISHRPFFSFG
jgi:hypothetical protein